MAKLKVQKVVYIHKGSQPGDIPVNYTVIKPRGHAEISLDPKTGECGIKVGRARAKKPKQRKE